MVTSKEVRRSVKAIGALYGFIGAAVFFALAHATPVVAQNVKEFIVRLQDATPGVPQVGHSNITGTAIAGQYIGGGAGLTGVNADLLDGINSTSFGRLSTSNTWTGANTFTGGFTTDAFAMNVGVTAGEVLKTDVNGFGTWERDGFTMPVTDAVTGVLTGLSLSHTGTGDLAIFTINNPASVAEAVQGASNGGGDVFQASMTGTGRAGYFAINNSASGSSALYATTNGLDANAIEGVASGGDGNGVYGMNAGNGAGVHGESTKVSGQVYGGFFEVVSPNGVGSYSLARGNSGTNTGAIGQSASVSGRGVFGWSTATSGVCYGIYGSVNSSAGYAVYSNGDFGASGTKAFRIDHPFNPQNKYLLHYTSESPFPQNFYVGNVVTDAKGYAWVELPDYFAEINTNFKYQLTVVDGPNSGADDFVQVKVRQKIKDGRFQIRASAANTEVSWRVDADRNDPYVRRKQPRDVIEKEGSERGTYQHPELYGEPK